MLPPAFHSQANMAAQVGCRTCSPAVVMALQSLSTREVSSLNSVIQCSACTQEAKGLCTGGLKEAASNMRAKTC